MSRKIAVSNGSVVKDLQRYVIAKGGFAKDIQRALVVDGGICRQYFPAAGDGSDSRIVMTDSAIISNASVADPTDAKARVLLLESGNRIEYDDYPNVALAIEPVLNPPLDGTVGDDGKYLVMMSGVGLGGPLDTWIDINSINTLEEWNLGQLVVGTSQVIGTFSIAADDGGGSPVAATRVDKQVTFIAEVRAAGLDKVSWSTVQRDLVELKEDVDATCVLNLLSNGVGNGEADTSGSFTENWHVDAPAVPDPENFTCRVNLISGTAPTGSALATDLLLSTSRQWTLLATTDEDLTCELDVLVGDGVDSITKRVTMHSQRGSLPTTNVWSATPAWAVSDDGFEVPEARAIVRVETNGTVVGDTLNSGEQHNEDYNSDAPTATDGINYEAKLTVVSGEAPDSGGPAVGIFHNCNIQLIWELIENDTAPPTIREKSGVWDLEIRRVGGGGVTKRITLSALLEDGEGGP